jgi:hypothetical protein
MSVVAAAVIGSAVVGGVVSYVSAEKASAASAAGASTAAQATVMSTQMQVDEIRRQFDYQQQVLQPQIQQQFNAQRAYSDLLGIGGPEYGANLDTGFVPEGRSAAEQQQAADDEIAVYEDYMQQAQTELEGLTLGSANIGDAVNMSQRRQELLDQISSYEGEIAGVRDRPSDQDFIASSNAARGAQMGRAGSSGVRSFQDEQGYFVDPNLDPTKLSEDTALGRSVMENRLAAGDISQDDYNNYLRENPIAAGDISQDVMVQRTGDVRLAEGAAGTGVYGDVFQESAGYGFAREEMQRASDRVGSAGGNFGGRAMIEAQRRAKGLADQEYYNWAQGRTSDLTRQAGAEAVDISRGDQAYAGYENQRISDISRQDQGYQDYLRRQQIDVGRMDTAATQEDALRATDQARGDQAYYNYLQNVARQAGFGGGSAAQAVDASQAAASGVGGAYGAQGANLSNIAANEGASQANIVYAQGAGVNNAIQAGMGNYITAGYAGADLPGFNN